MSSYAGTQIGADGSRYTIGDEDMPTTAPAAAGKIVTQAALDAQIAATLAETVGAVLPADREITVTTVSADATVTVTSGTMTDKDTGAQVSGTGIPSGATIASVTDGTHFELSAAATASGAGVTATVVQNVSGWLTDHENRIGVLEP